MRTTPIRITPIRRRSQLAGKVASPHTPTGVPTRAPLRSAASGATMMARRNWRVRTRPKTALYRETSGTARVGGIRKGRRANATNPRPNPASPNTQLASARMPAPASHVRLTGCLSPTRAQAGRHGTSVHAGDQAAVSPAPPDRYCRGPSPGHDAAHGRAPLGLGTCPCTIPRVARPRSPETPRRRIATNSAGRPTSRAGWERSGSATRHGGALRAHAGSRCRRRSPVARQTTMR